MLGHLFLPLLIATAVVAIIATGAAMYRPRGFLLVVVFLLPFLPKWAGLQFAERMPVLNPLKMVLLLLAAAWWLHRRSGPPVPRRPLSTALYLLVAAELFSVASSVLADTGGYAVGFTTVVGKVLYFYGLFVIVYDLMDSRDAIDALVTVLAVSGIVCGLQAVVEVFLQWNPYNFIPRFDIEKGMLEGAQNQLRLALPRAQGAFTQSISFGIYLGMALPLVFYRAGAAPTLLRRVAWSAGAALVGLGEILTLSRGAIAATVVVFAVALIRTWRGALILALAITAGATFIATGTSTAALGARTLIVGSFDPTVSDELSSSTFSRLESLRLAVQDIGRAMPFGLGPQWRSRGYLVSVYLLYLIRSGIVAFVAMSYVMLAILLRLYGVHRGAADEDVRRLAMWLLVAAASFATALMTVDQDDALFFFFIVAAVGYRLAALPGGGPAPASAPAPAE